MHMDVPGNDVQLVKFVLEYQRQHHAAPTMREIAEGLGMTSTNGVRYWLKVCEYQGWVMQRRMVARGISVTAKGRKEAGA